MTAAAMVGPPIPFGGVAPNGPGVWDGRLPANSDFALTTNANQARIMYGYMMTSDGAAHTLSAAGGGTIGFLNGTVTFAQATSVLTFGLATMDTATGPPGRATNVSNLITFSTSKTWLGNAAHGMTTGTWHSSAMDAGSLSVTPGDLIAFAVQLTAWVTTDTIGIRCGDSGLASNLPGVTNLTGPSTYAAATATPNVFITFDDGAFGYFLGSQVFSVGSTGTGNFGSGSSPNEYGNLFQFNFPVTILGATMFTVAPANAFDFVLYADPLGTPSAVKTLSVNKFAIGSVTGSRRCDVMNPAGYVLAANTPIAGIMKPTSASTISAAYRTVFASSHQVTMNLGTGCYAVNRSGGSGAFASQNSGKDRFNMCLLVSALDDGAGGGGGMVAGNMRGGFVN